MLGNHGRLFTPPSTPPRKLKTGSLLYYGLNIGNDITSSTVGQNWEQAVPFDVANTITIDRIGIEITTAFAAAVYRLGIRNDDGGYPGALLLDAGTIDASTTGFKEITISQLLSAGKYWFTGTSQIAGPINVRCAAGGRNPELGVLLAGVASSNRSYRQVNGGGALSAGFSATPNLAGENPLILVRVA